MKWQIIVVLILIFIGLYLYFATLLGPIEPMGRLGFVKLANPDMYPGHPHSQLLAEYAHEKGSKSALVVHFAGDSNYQHYMEGDVLIIEMAFIDTKGTGAGDPTNYIDSLKIALFGVPDGRYMFKIDGKEFKDFGSAMKYVNKLAAQNGQKGPIPMVWHGTSRKENPIFNQGCGFPLYFYIVWHYYGPVAAYYYTIKGMMLPYLSLPYKNFELQHASELQYYYVHDMLNYQ